MSISCALIARIVLFLLLPMEDRRIATAAYVVFNILEKPLLLTGMVRFLNLDMRIRGFWIAGVAAETWLLVTLIADTHPLFRSMGYATVNAGLLAYMAWLALSKSGEVRGLPLRITAVASGLLAIHWFGAPIVIYFHPTWFKDSFLIGTFLVLVQYFSLLTAVLTLFQQRLVDAEAQALDLAFHDPLTGLSNKRYMSTLFDQALLLATRPHHVVAMLYIDLDNFKPINDKAGHDVGDEVLKIIAARLKSHTRSTDICARIGGDEFVVIATQLINEEQALEIGNKLLAQMMTPVEVNGRSYPLGASIGIGLYPRHADNLPELMKYADCAMYEVKRSGKNRCEVYQASMACAPN
ncbi:MULTISPECIES: GGDEF domain-containing protein [unclassified Duganella]|uniref:GGDEF domain-containing protein n=1 Tax=unclassified Duganella TaxID=2636909 RepID=UPI001E47DDC7|nr:MULTISPECIES: GGDEF domain-containing protein [unclassified Duganella]